jgi:lipocalin
LTMEETQIPRHRVMKIFIGTTLLLFLSLIPSCADRDAPDTAAVQKILASFYEGQGYKVVSLDLGGIEGAPLAQKTYGRKRAYYVTVKKLLLEGKGQKLTRQNGTITVREKRGEPGVWDIERVPPELAP